MDKTQIIEALKSMTILEINELVKALKSLNDLSLIHCFSPFSNLLYAACMPPKV